MARARRSEVTGEMANGAVPENGRANDEVCEVVAAYLGVAKRNVEVMFGHAT